MDSSFYLVVAGISLVFVLLIAFVAWTFFSRYKRLGTVLNRAHEMTKTATGTISEIVTVTRRNRSFRWKNEYPVISFAANGKQYTVHMDWAEKRKGHYDLGGTYKVCYVPADPGCCVVEEFRKTMQKTRTQSLIWTVVFGLVALNMLFSIILQTITSIAG
ncbi:MAG: hypothetical protein HFG49_05905 [Lachnospiraceae bacterium]|jgi:hypothetical protein|nr:hypothetical protein [Lachnospiraceae bacterium]